MKRPVIVVIGVVVILIALVAKTLFSLNWQEQEVEVGFHPSVAKDSFTMAQRLLDRHEISWFKYKQFAAEADAGALTINEGTKLIIDEAALSESYELNQQLLTWIRGGGELVYVLSSQRNVLGIDNSTLFQALGITINVKENEATLSFSTNTQPNKNTDLALNSDNILTLKISEKYSIENCPAREVKNDAEQVVICDMNLGDGRVTVLPSLAPFTNNNLRYLDHGSLLLWLAGDASNITYIPYLSYSNWFAKLWGWSWQLVMTLFVLIVLWVWYVSSRIGQAYSPDTLIKASFNNHIQAVANFLIGHGHEKILIDALHRDFYSQVELRVPNFKKLTNEQQVNTIAQLTSFNQQNVTQLLSSQLPESEQQRTEYIKRFKQLRNAL
ncbi:DUF4350 domain-containing protein [Pseudoalteromonas sp. TB64]|uniref:DUF4350 domain-containing protein n=1 Tax=Pseudoalteromonas sp. TB64 TaxID=1938600 RepID=UPI0004251E5C|nr:DUF4350 domain-containing protein [Pseudoalteromonas sp. TB64]